MNQTIRPRRSVLYMPGSNNRALEKARNLSADCLILDLEDSVAPEAKPAARDQVVAALQTGGYGHRELIVRVNGLDTTWGNDDLLALAGAGMDAILLPKIESAATLETVAAILDSAAAATEVPLWIMTETPRGVLELDSILRASPRVTTVVLGTSDLARELHINTHGDRTGLIYALSHSVLAARSHGLDIIDGVHLVLDDTDGLRQACEQGRKLGFDGKSLIHPSQIDVANECFGVSAAEAESAREIVTAWQDARQAGSGLTVVRGQLIEQLHVDEAERVLAIYAATTQF